MACGLSTTYPQLVAARMTVGVGEAGGVPPSYAIISDYFPPARRGVALSLYNLGPPIGQAVGVAVGASIAAAYGWRRGVHQPWRGRSGGGGHGADSSSASPAAAASMRRRPFRRLAFRPQRPASWPP